MTCLLIQRNILKIQWTHKPGYKVDRLIFFIFFYWLGYSWWFCNCAVYVSCKINQYRQAGLFCQCLGVFLEKPHNEAMIPLINHHTKQKSELGDWMEMKIFMQAWSIRTFQKERIYYEYFFHEQAMYTAYFEWSRSPECRSLHTWNAWIAYFVPQEVSMCLNNPSSTFRSHSLSEVDVSEYCTLVYSQLRLLHF